MHIMGVHFLTWFIIIQVGDFGDANSWPTPGEIATKDMQVGAPVQRMVVGCVLWTAFQRNAFECVDHLLSFLLGNRLSAR